MKTKTEKRSKLVWDPDGIARELVHELNDQAERDEIVSPYAAKSEVCDVTAAEYFPLAEQKEVNRRAEELRDRITVNPPFVFYRDSLAEAQGVELLRIVIEMHEENIQAENPGKGYTLAAHRRKEPNCEYCRIIRLASGWSL